MPASWNCVSSANFVEHAVLQSNSWLLSYFQSAIFRGNLSHVGLPRCDSTRNVRSGNNLFTTNSPSYEPEFESIVHEKKHWAGWLNTLQTCRQDIVTLHYTILNADHFIPLPFPSNQF